jgi:hypothetical protein
MLSRITRSGGPVVTIANYCTAFNFVYDKKKLGRPWSGGEMTELITSYASASQLRSADLGVEVASMRIATPAVGIAHMMRLLNTLLCSKPIDSPTFLRSESKDTTGKLACSF